MPTVTGTEKDPGGIAHGNALVRIRLVTTPVGVAPGYVVGSNFSIEGEFTTRTNGSGVWTIDLVSNELISPANTYYLADVQPPLGQAVRHVFTVPNGAGPYRVEDILTDPPADMPTTLGDLVAALTATVAGKVDVAGDTMTGPLVVPGGTIGSPGLQLGSADSGLYVMEDDGQVAMVANGALIFHTGTSAGTGLRRDVGDPVVLGGRIYVEDELFVEDDLWADESFQITAANLPPAATTLSTPAAAGDQIINVSAVPPSWVVDKTLHFVKTAGAQYDRPRIRAINGLSITLESPLRFSYPSGQTVLENPWRGALYPTATWPVPGGVMTVGADLTPVEVVGSGNAQVVLLAATHCRYRLGLAKVFSPDWAAEGGLTTATGGFGLSVSAAVFAKDSDVCQSTTQALTVVTPHASLPRIDIVVLSGAGVASIVVGTPNASPAAPATPAGSLLVAHVAVAAAAASIVQGNITFKLDRPMRLRVADPANGGYVFGPRDDTGVRMRIYDGVLRIVEGLQDGAFASLDLNASGGRVTVGAGGLAVAGVFGANGATAVGRQTLGPAATDLASVITLANNLRAALIALGLGQT